MIRTPQEAFAFAARRGFRAGFEEGEGSSAAVVCARSDRARRTIAVSRRVRDVLAERHGAGFADAFVVCAVLHELAHLRRTGATEAAAHAFVRAKCRFDPHEMESRVRMALPR